MVTHVLISAFEARRVARMLRALFAGKLRPDEEFVISGEVDATWVGVRFELRAVSGAFSYPVEARVARRSGGLRDGDLKEALFDLLGHLFEGYLTERPRVPFTGVEWEEVDYAGHKVWLRGQERDPRSEQDADRLLADAALAEARAARALGGGDDGSVD